MAKQFLSDIEIPFGFMPNVPTDPDHLVNKAYADLLGGASAAEFISNAANGSKTLFTDADFTSPGFNYETGAGQIAVYFDGVRQDSTDYTETSSTSITFNVAVEADIKVTIFVGATDSGFSTQALEITEYLGTSTAAQSTITAANLSPSGLSFVAGIGAVELYLDGVKQSSKDFTENGSNQLDLVSPIEAGLDIEVKVSKAIGLASNWKEISSAFTAVDQDRIFANTDGGSFTITLPASPSIGDTVKITDGTGNFATANLTIARNGSNIMGSALDLVLSADNDSKELVFFNITNGWGLV